MAMAEKKEPKFQVGQTVRHVIWGDVRILGVRHEAGPVFYDLSPSFDRGELRMEGGKYCTPELMLYEAGEPLPKTHMFSGDAAY